MSLSIPPQSPPNAPKPYIDSVVPSINTVTYIIR